jgi:hypothetical protein
LRPIALKPLDCHVILAIQGEMMNRATLLATLLLAITSGAVAAPSITLADESQVDGQLGSAWIDEAPSPPMVRRAGIAVQRVAGSLKLGKVEAYDTAGLDTVAQYASSDGAISGSIFIYYPSLADTGLTFLATDATIRRRFGAATRIDDDRLVPVGGVPEAGRRVTYVGASDGTRSTAATFVRAGGWIIVLRVSGPASRASEILANLDALTAGLTSGRNNPVRAHVIHTEDCTAKSAPDATILKPTGSEVAARLVMVVAETRDEKGRALEDFLGRVPDRLCLLRAGGGEAVELTYKVPAKTKGLYAPRLFHLVGDAGFLIEATAPAKDPERVMMLRHGIGGLEAYGLFRGLPSFSQIDSVAERDEGLPMLAKAAANPDGGGEVTLGCVHLQEGCKSER